MKNLNIDAVTRQFSDWASLSKCFFGDTAKYLMPVAGLFFGVTFLIVQQASVFCGLMMWTTATLKTCSPAFLWWRSAGRTS